MSMDERWCQICGKMTHWNTGGCTEHSVAYYTSDGTSEPIIYNRVGYFADIERDLKIAKLEEQILKMKRCDNCKHNLNNWDCAKDPEKCTGKYLLEG